MRLLFLFLVLLPLSSYTQRVVDRAGEVSFYSSAPLEDIRAVTKTAIGIIDLQTGEVAVSIPMASFDFPKKLMQEHFNDNYVESEKYPKATLVGQITNWPDCRNKTGPSACEFAGELEIHGISRPYKISVEFIESNEVINVNCTFDIRLEDHDIDIPTLVIEKIAEVIEVTAKFKFKTNP